MATNETTTHAPSSLHYELTDETTTTAVGATLHRLRALRDLPQHGVKAGDLGGWVYHGIVMGAGAWVWSYASIGSGASIGSYARIESGASIGSGQHILVLGPIGSESVTVTLYRTKTGHKLVVGCWSGQVDALAAEVERRARSWGGSDADKARWRAEYAALLPLLEARIVGWHPAATAEAVKD